MALAGSRARQVQWTNVYQDALVSLNEVTSGTVWWLLGSSGGGATAAYIDFALLS